MPSGNPFEIVPRLSETERLAQPAAAAPGGNPFDIIRDPAALTAAAQPPRPTLVTAPAVRQPAGSTVAATGAPGSILIIHLIMLLWAAILLVVLRGHYGQAYRSLFSENMLNQLQRQRTGGRGGQFYLAYIYFFLNGGLFLYLITRHLQVPTPESPWVWWLGCSGALAGAFLLKHFVLGYLGSIFPLRAETDKFSFTIMLFAGLLGLALIPVNLLLSFAPPWAVHYVFYGGLALVAAYYALRSLRGLLIVNKYWFSDPGRLVIYALAVEVAPALLLVKVLGGF